MREWREKRTVIYFGKKKIKNKIKHAYTMQLGEISLTPFHKSRHTYSWPSIELNRNGEKRSSANVSFHPNYGHTKNTSSTDRMACSILAVTSRSLAYYPSTPPPPALSRYPGDRSVGVGSRSINSRKKS